MIDVKKLRPWKSVELVVYASLPPDTDVESLAMQVKSCVETAEPQAFDVIVDVASED